MATIRDVAKACGVSPATVSGVLNNTPDAAGPETRERVLERCLSLAKRLFAKRGGARSEPPPNEHYRRGDGISRLGNAYYRPASRTDFRWNRHAKLRAGPEDTALPGAVA